MSYELLRIAVTPQMSQEEIVALLIANPDNGAYATSVCRSCGVFRTDPNGRAHTAKITDSCKHCSSTAEPVQSETQEVLRELMQAIKNLQEQVKQNEEVMSSLESRVKVMENRHSEERWNTWCKYHTL